MEFYEVLNRRRSIRQFEDRAILREVLERVLDAGLKAPSSNHQRQGVVPVQRGTLFPLKPS